MIRVFMVFMLVLSTIWLFDRKYDKGGYYDEQYHRDTFWKANPDTLKDWNKK
jgi:hypothetical protein